MRSVSLGYSNTHSTFTAVISASDNAKIASCGVDRAVILWDVGTGEILRRYTAHWEVKKEPYSDMVPSTKPFDSCN